MIIIIIIIIKPRGFQIPDGNWRCIFGSLAVRLKCTRKINKGHVPQGSRTGLGSKNVLLNRQPQGELPASPSTVITTRKKEKDKRQKCSRENYKEVMYAFYMSLERP